MADRRIVIAQPELARKLLELIEDHGGDAASVSELWRGEEPGRIEIVIVDADESALGEGDSGERLRAALSAAKVGLWEWELGSERVFYSREWKRQLGYAVDEIGDGFDEWRSRVHPDDLDRAMAAIRAYLRDPSTPYEAEVRMRHKDGCYRWILTQASVERGLDDRRERMRGSHVDVTERKQAELALAASEARLRHVADAVPHLIWELSLTGEMRYANRALREYFGRASIAFDDWAALIHPDDFPSAEGLLGRALAAAEGRALVPIRLRRHDGVYRWFDHYAAVVRDADGEPSYVVGSSSDIHELKQTRDALAEAQQRLMAALAAAGMGTWRWDIDADRVAIDAAMAGLLGRSEAELARAPMSAILAEIVHPDDRSDNARALEQALAEGPGAELALEWRSLRPDGATQWLATSGRLVRDDSDGRLLLVGATVDVTRRKGLEAQLHQAQKMEAIGLLAGGVAHDFNNILTVVLGHATLLEAHPALPDELQTSVHEIVIAAEQAAALTSQLLAFSRRQVLQRRDLDLDGVVSELLDLVRRLLGPRVECAYRALESGPIIVHADRSMLTQVLLNLVVNARDAMAGEGRLTITTRIGPVPERPGDWALLEVADDGRGIDPEVLPHVFEPFFTTKGVGQGTGLGLATVYGIVEQHRGCVRVESEPGRGTRFIVALPRARPEAQGARSGPDQRLGTVPNT